MKTWYLYIAVFLSAFLASLAFTPQAKKIAIKLNAIDIPKARGLNTVPKPRMGGLAIIFGFFVAMAIAFPFEPALHTVQFLGFVIGAIIIIILGMLDDINPIRARVKFFVQILSALIAVLTGTVIQVSGIPFIEELPFINELVTVIWIVGLTNAVNLIDGLDGLAAGVTAICSSCIFILCVTTGSSLAVIFSAALAGSSLGFLPRNFNPSELIMGDTGSTFLGYVLAVSSIIGVFKGYALISVVIAVFALALPIFDTAFAMGRRFVEGRPIMSPDRGHLHHRLVDSGLSQKKSVFILYFISLVCCTIAILIATDQFNTLVVLIVLVVVLFSMVYVYNKRIDADINNKTNSSDKNINDNNKDDVNDENNVVSKDDIIDKEDTSSKKEN